MRRALVLLLAIQLAGCSWATTRGPAAPDRPDGCTTTYGAPRADMYTSMALFTPILLVGLFMGIDAIVSASDVVMVARGDLGVEIGPAAVPLVQKRVILSALEHGKPAITATQMLESMIRHPEPSRAEASDVANAVLDGTSALMLSGETAAGNYPIESVVYMDRIARAVEPSLEPRHELARAADAPFPTVGEAMSNAACDIAEVLGAVAILVPTYSGRTASAVARHRPQRPIIAVTPVETTWRRLALLWGTEPVLVDDFVDDFDEASAMILRALRRKRKLTGAVVVTAGLPFSKHGRTNTIRVEEGER